MFSLRAAAFLGALGLTVFATGCSGGGGGATPPLANADPGTTNNLPISPGASSTGGTGNSVGTLSITKNANGTVTLTGTVAAIKSSTEFEIQGGSGVGYLNVYTTSSTQKNYGGKSLAAGEPVTVVGTGSASTYVTAQSVTIDTTTSTAPTPAPGQISVSGTVVALKSSTEFEINGGSGVGYLNIYTTSSTVDNFNGHTLSDGVNVTVVGTGSAATYVTAASVTIGSTTTQSGPIAPAPGQIQVAGSIVAIKSSSEFEINGGAGVGYLDIYTTSSTVDYFNGLKLAVGTYATINGSGSASTYVTAANITLSSGSTTSPSPTAPPATTAGVPSHVQTADYFEGYYGTFKVSPAQAAPHLTWAQTTTADSSAIAAAGIKTQIYLDPNREASTDPIYGYIKNEPSAFAHNCSGTMVTMKTGSLIQDVTNPASSDLRTAVASYTATQKADGHVDMVFEDNGGFLEPSDTYPNGMPCGYSVSSWISATEGLDQASAIPIIANGLNLYTSSSLSPVIGLVKGSSNTVGGNMEHCFTDNSRAIQYGTAWTQVQNTAIQIVGDGKYYECMARNTNPAVDEITPRLFTIASFLMTYNPNLSILQEEFGTNTGLAVMPESELVPLDPVQTATSSITQLRTSTGVYARQFNACYLRGSSVGACVVAVNNDDVSERFPYSGYTHTLVISGSGVLDGGSVSVNGGAAPSTLAPGQAVVAFK